MKSIVIIPIYKEEINEGESISLRQGKEIFKDEEICYLAPYWLKDSNILKGDIPVAYFDDKYFKNIESYSQLMLSVDFYKWFQCYDYMLIYQLDAFVFSNRIQEFASYRYDYIGACVPAYYWPHLNHRVGNGGFSLRNIRRCINLLNQKEEILKMAENNLEENIYQLISTIEDEFFAYCGNQDNIDFTLAPVEIAQNFSVEYEVGGRYETLGNNLPFGCHRWYQSALDIWWPYIHEQGFNISESFKKTYQKSTILSDDYKLFKWIEKPQYYNIIKKLFLKKTGDKEIIIFGGGIRGKRLLCLMNTLGILPVCIVDSSFGVEKTIGDILYMPPRYDVFVKRNRIVIITPRDAYGEILSFIKKGGIDTDKSCIIYSDLVLYITECIDRMENSQEDVDK